jgi:hypothetical protein
MLEEMSLRQIKAWIEAAEREQARHRLEEALTHGFVWLGRDARQHLMNHWALRATGQRLAAEASTAEGLGMSSAQYVQALMAARQQGGS